MTRGTMRSLAAGAAFAALIASASGGWAQTIAADRDQQPRSETEGQAPPAAASPSERLDRQNGVMQPPRGVDPQMQVPPPPGSQPTPVIPPPGSPGGDPTIQPK